MRLAMLDFAFARQQFDRAHLAHVHAHRVGGAAELGVDRGGERLRRFFGGLVVGDDRLAHQQRLGVRCLFVHRDAHVVDHLHDVFDLLRIDDLGGQVVVDFGVGQEALFLAARNQQLELRLAVFRRAGRQLDLDLLGLFLACLAAGLLGLRRGNDGLPGHGGTGLAAPGATPCAGAAVLPLAAAGVDPLAAAGATLWRPERSAQRAWPARPAWPQSQSAFAGTCFGCGCRSLVARLGCRGALALDRHRRRHLGCGLRCVLERGLGRGPGCGLGQGLRRALRRRLGLDRRSSLAGQRCLGLGRRGGLAGGELLDLFACRRLAQDGRLKRGLKKSGIVPCAATRRSCPFIRRRVACGRWGCATAKAPAVPAFRPRPAPNRGPWPSIHPAVAPATRH